MGLTLDIDSYVLDLQGWGSNDPIFQELINRIPPELIIEVGSWKGASAIHMASLSIANIICIDTWLGSEEFYNSIKGDNERDLQLLKGYPTIYYQFLANCLLSGYNDRISSIPLPSNIASRILYKRNIQADLIYIDGSHDYKDVIEDMYNYWPLVKNGGIMFGDDLDTFTDVNRAVYHFGNSINQNYERIGRHWVFTKV